MPESAAYLKILNAAFANRYPANFDIDGAVNQVKGKVDGIIPGSLQARG